MNPNVINIFSNDDLIKSIEIDHEVKNNNTNSFDELLHKVDNEKVFSEDNLLNASHDKTEVENKTSNNSNKNELNENKDAIKPIIVMGHIFPMIKSYLFSFSKARNGKKLDKTLFWFSGIILILELSAC